MTWTRDGDDVTVERERLDNGRHATCSRIGTTATVLFAGTNHQGVATWAAGTRNGSFEIDGQTKVCWEHVDADFCTVTCP